MSGTFDSYAAYYDLLYAEKDYRGEAGYVLDLARKHSVATSPERGLEVLELGCGTGRHAEHFAAAGCKVCGVDRSPEMIALGSKRLRGVVGVNFEVGDATSVRLPERFDVVLALFHVLSYQTEDEAVGAFFHTAVTHLRPGGLVVFDFWHGPGVLHDPPSTRIRRLSSESLNVLRLAEPTSNLLRNFVDVDYTLFFNRPGEETWRRVDESHRMRYFFLPELSAFQERFGVTPVHYYPWMKLDGAPDLTNWHAVLVGRKELR